MTYPLMAMMQLGVVPQVTFPTNSRYHGTGVLQYVAPDGRVTAYLQRRFVPMPSTRSYEVINRHVVEAQDRSDVIAARYLGDPLLAWRLCDANGVMSPSELTEELGAEIVITAPQGVPGGGVA